MGLVLISTATISSSVASVTIEANIDATYDLYEFHFENIHFSADDYSKIVCYFRTAADDGYDQLVTSANHYIGSYENNVWSAANVQDSSSQNSGEGAAQQHISEASGDENFAAQSGILRLYTPADTTFHKKYYSHIETYNYNGGMLNVTSSGIIETTAAITGVRFAAATGGSTTMDAGKIHLYGVV